MSVMMMMTMLLLMMMMMMMMMLIMMMVLIKRLRTKSQSLVVIWKSNLLKVAVHSCLHSLLFNSGRTELY